MKTTYNLYDDILTLYYHILSIHKHLHKMCSCNKRLIKLFILTGHY